MVAPAKGQVVLRVAVGVRDQRHVQGITAPITGDREVTAMAVGQVGLAHQVGEVIRKSVGGERLHHGIGVASPGAHEERSRADRAFEQDLAGKERDRAIPVEPLPASRPE